MTVATAIGWWFDISLRLTFLLFGIKTITMSKQCEGINQRVIHKF